ncbi:MAG: after-VIT domain-containing protein [Oscillatoriales cyanobacterium RM2_1_1]|nr:after-VIT domain-containing protein [Oscillatoriales cyanobacterium SM2_3_0]NJO45051.1 after-VIT domain-containing protein [Oscillatoriales cyanobacterium RM2_1_1]
MNRNYYLLTLFIHLLTHLFTPVFTRLSVAVILLATLGISSTRTLASGIQSNLQPNQQFSSQLETSTAVKLNQTSLETLSETLPETVKVAQTSPRNTSSAPSTSPGGLYIRSQKDISAVFPLKKTDVKARVTGNISRVEVTQTFENPFSESLEAIYVFPLPDEAAVDDMEIKIGDRTIKSLIKTREQAQEIYQQARQQGRTAGLLEQERDNIFTQSLANIKPGEQIQVTIRYTDSLKFERGDYEFVFPMVVGPRYSPGNLVDGTSPKTDRVPDAGRITPPVLPPGVRSGHDIQVEVEIEAGVPVKNLRSPSHEIRSQTQGNSVVVNLAAGDIIPNQDLILRYQVSGNQTQATVLTERNRQGGHFAAYLIPALQYQPQEIVPKDVVFLMDTSGSQRGEPLAKSKQLMRRFIQGLNSADTFTIIDFSDTTTALSATPLTNTAEHRQQAIAYINQLEAQGGTELLNGIQAVLNFPAPEIGRLRSVVLLTDGYIGNETEVLAEVQRQLQPGNRLYSFGVGTSVNRFLLDRLAEMGRGTTQIIRPDEPSEPLVEQFFQRINNPVLTDIQVNWEGDAAVEIYPKVPADLFDTQPLVVLGRRTNSGNGRLQITGTQANGDRYEQVLTVNFAPGSVNVPESSGSEVVSSSIGNPAIAQLWGRAKIKHLANQMLGGETKSGVERITQTALDYRLLSPYTAFVAVSEEVRVDPNGQRRTVQVPVELPEGVSREGIFGPASPELFRSQSSGQGPLLIRRSFSAEQQPMPAPGTRRAEIAPMPTPVSPPMPVSPSPSPSTRVAANRSSLKVTNAQGLDQVATAELNRYLQGVSLPNQVQGQVIFELSVKNGNVQRIVLDDLASSLKLTQGGNQAIVIDRIRRSLQTWQPPSGISGTIRIALQVDSL